MSLITTTVKEFLKDSSSIVGKWNSCETLALLNKARRVLWAQDWLGTIEYGCVQITDKCFTLPSRISAVREAWAGGVSANLENTYYWSIDRNLLDECCRTDCAKPTISRNDSQVIFPGLRRDCQVKFQLTEEESSEGVTIEISYIDNNNSRVNEEAVLTSASPLYETDYKVRRFNGINKKNASGPVKVLQGNKLIYTIAPHEANPASEVYRCFGGPYDQLVIKGKLKYYKYETQSYNQYLDLNPDALEWAMQAVQIKDSGSIESPKEYLEKIALAHGELEIATESIQAGFAPSLPSEMYPEIIATPS